MDFEEKTVLEGYVYRGKIINLRVDEVSLPNGKKAKREMIEHGGGCAVLCVENGKILLVKQFRYAYKESIWEIPAGKINKGEDPLSTAYRELEEECGVKAKKMQLLYTSYPTPGYTNEVIRIYRAEGLERTETNFDDDEFIVSKWFSIAEARKMVESGEIKDAKTLIALLHVFANNG